MDGGAQSTCGGSQTTAGHGGGLVGGYSKNTGSWYYGHIAYGGSQTAGGSFTYGSNTYHNGIQGEFGKGANSGTCAAGGGGGYYGGGSVYTAGGGGGSSFVSGYDGCDITYRDFHKDINGNLFEFTDVTLEQGNNIGNGKATIEFIRE